MADDFDKLFGRLKKAVDWSTEQLKELRDERVNTLKQYVGSHYAQNGAFHHVPVNMIELATTIYVGRLAARAPRVMVSTGVDHLKPFARNMQLALNQIPDEIDLGGTIRRAVVEAIFGVGVVKVGLSSSDVSMEGHDPGEPFVDLVPLDDYFLDMSAKNRSGIQFEGNDYWLSLDEAREMYEGDSSDIDPDDHTVHGEKGERRAESVAIAEGADLYKEKVWMRDVWLPDTQQVITYGVKSQKVFRVVDWDGPEGGPYHVLSFNEVPGNLLPLPPASLWIDLHELGNKLFRKLAKQAEGKKTVVAFAGGNDRDAEKLKSAADGEGIAYQGQKPEQITVGGIDSESLAFYLQVYDQFSRFAGNLDSLGGLGPVTETGVQDRMISEAASVRMEDYGRSVIKFTRGVFQALAWYEWTDPVRERVIQKPVEGTDIVLTRVWSEETREGDFLDYNLDIDPYSMQDDTPSLRLQKILRTFNELILPLLPVLQAQGVQIDVPALIEVVARLSNLDELRGLFVLGEPIQGDPQQGGSETPGFKPSNTHRTYERINRPGATRHGKDDVMSRLLMGGGVQKSEAAAIGRPTS